MSLIAKVFRCLFWTGFAVYIVAAAVLLGLRYWILPNIDQWRPRIEAYASEALGARVQIGHLRANWRGLNPSLRLTSLVVYDPNNEPVLTLPTVSAVLGWRSVLVLSPRLLSLRVDDPELWVRRDATDHLWVAGQSINLNTAGDEHGRSPLVRWLANQRDLALVGATVHWQDELRQAPDVALRNVSLRLYNGLLSHRFALSAEPPASLAGGVMLRGSFYRNPLQAGAPRWTGDLYAEIKDAQPEAWAPWLSVPAVSGRGAARAWLTLDKGKVTDLTADAALREVRWQAKDDASATPTASHSGGNAPGTSSASASQVIERSTARSGSDTKTQPAQMPDGQAVPSGQGLALRLESGTFHLQGPPGSVVQWEGVPLAPAAEDAGMTVRAELTGFQANLPETFDPALLQADTVRLDATVRHPSQQPLVVDVRQFDLANDDLDARLNGRWIGQGKTIAGTADFQGNLARGRMSAIHKYLPLTVNADAREWLARGLPAGHIRDASVTVKGDLDEFPFEDKEDHGQFRIAGAYSGATVDYAPPHGRNNRGWPRLENLSGNFAVDKVSLSLDTPGGAIARVGDDLTLSVGAVRASIPDMEHASTLHLDGEISGAVPAYMALANHYQLGQLLDGILDTAEGTGNWRVPLKLEVPLLNAEDTKVDGRIVFAGNDFRFVPQMPMLRELQGELMFSERGLRADALRTEFLGGQARISGRLEQRDDVLRVEGTMPASGLAQWLRNPLMERLSGQTSYRGHVGYGPGGILDLALDSDLTGMAIDLPAPVGKAKAAALPLKASWGAPSAAESGKRDRLSVNLGSNVALLLEHDRAARGGYFTRGALGVSRPAALPATAGMQVDVQIPELDLDAWQQVAEEAGGTKKTDSDKAAARADALPMLNRINLAAQRLRVAGWSMDNLTLAATRPQPTQWQVSLDSKQAAGSLSWQEASGAIAGRVTARLKHLALGGDADVATSMPVKDGPTPDDDLSDIPAIDLQADQFSLYGSNVGKLEVVGTNMERGQLWRLDKLHIGNEAATLDATGHWRLKGAQRGLAVDAKAQFKDLGAFVDRIGFKDEVGGGSGSIVGKMTWHDLPWTHDLANLEGNVQISLDKGRFLNVNSRSARVLELLSLQSLQRLAKLEANPADAWRDGFPFDTIRGDMALSRGIAHTEGFKLNGPVATIVLAGDTDIVAEQWNMKAVVIPNLDASGAAVVTALAVNPLIGLGAFVTQWLLKQPLAHAMTMEYAVTGSWDDPKVAPVETKHEPNHSPNNDYVEH